MSNPITSKNPTPAATVVTRTRKPATQDDINTLLSELTSTAVIPQKSAAEVERERRLEVLNSTIAELIGTFFSFTGGASDLEAKAGVLRSIKTAKSRIAVTLDSLADRDLLGDQLIAN